MKTTYTIHQKTANWWHYHWLWVLAGVVALGLFAHLIWSSLTAPKWDLQIAVIVKKPLPLPVLTALSEGLSQYTTDLDGNGNNRVEVVQYVVNFRTDAENVDPKVQSAGVAGMMADLRNGYSQVFLMDDPNGFSLSTGALRYRDGTLPADEVYPTAEQTSYLWTACPALTNLELGEYDASQYGGSGNIQTELSHLYVGSRGFWEETSTEHPAEDEALWQALTAGAVQQ